MWEKIKNAATKVIVVLFWLVIIVYALYEFKGIFFKSVDEAQNEDYLEHIENNIP